MKDYTTIKEDTVKPDFYKLACEHYDKASKYDDGNETRAYAAGMEKIWNDYVPKSGYYISQHERIKDQMKEIEELKHTIGQHQEYETQLLVSIEELKQRIKEVI